MQYKPIKPTILAKLYAILADVKNISLQTVINTASTTAFSIRINTPVDLDKSAYTGILNVSE